MEKKTKTNNNSNKTHCICIVDKMMANMSYIQTLGVGEMR